MHDGLLRKIHAHTRTVSVGCSKGSYHTVEEVEVVVVVEVEAWMMGTSTGAHYGKDFEENRARSTQEKMVRSSQNQLGGALKTCAQKSDCNVLYSLLDHSVAFICSHILQVLDDALHCTQSNLESCLEFLHLVFQTLHVHFQVKRI